MAPVSNRGTSSLQPSRKSRWQSCSSKRRHYAAGVFSEDRGGASDLSALVKANGTLNFRDGRGSAGALPAQPLLGASDYRLLCCPRPYYRVQRQATGARKAPAEECFQTNPIQSPRGPKLPQITVDEMVEVGDIASKRVRLVRLLGAVIARHDLTTRSKTGISTRYGRNITLSVRTI